MGLSAEEVDLWTGLKSVRVFRGNLFDAGGYGDDDDDSDFDDGEEPIDPPLFKGESLLEKLELVGCAIGSRAMGDTLRDYPRLKHLLYTYGGPIVNDQCANFDPPRLRLALLEVKNTLEYLEIDPLGCAEFSR